MPGHLVLKGEKISLWTITKEDIKEIWKYLEDKEIRQQIFWPDLIVYPEDLEEFYDRIRNSKSRKSFLIVRNDDNKAVGMIELFVNEYHRNAEIVYWIAKEFRNK